MLVQMVRGQECNGLSDLQDSKMPGLPVLVRLCILPSIELDDFESSLLPFTSFHTQ